MKTVAFELSMPNPPSWNRRWSGEDRLWVLCRRLKDDLASRIAAAAPYRYRWSDGWVASISARLVDFKEAAKLKRKSSGFQGYEWMVSSIIEHGKIITESELRKETA